MTPERVTRGERRIRVAGVLVILGLLVEVVTLLVRGPISFLVFMFLGGALVLAGMLTYLLSFIGGGAAESAESTESRG